MIRPLASLAATMASLAGAPAASAQEKADAAPKLTVEIEALSDYRYRGVSLSDGEPAFQAEALLEFDSGIWASAWGSTLTGGDVELQLGLGYSKDIFGRLNFETSFSYYLYPSDSSSNYFEAAAALSYPLGRLKPRIGLEYAPRQENLVDDAGRRRDNLYAYLAVELEIANTPLTLDGALGYETGVFDTRERGGKWDWRVGAVAATRWFDVGIAYIDSNGRLIDRRGRNLADETLVGSIGRSF